jgi:uroporphyrinogen-III decarboxylase
MGLRDPDIDRLLRAFTGKKPDRVPVHEIAVHSPTLEHVMGRSLEGGETGVYLTTEVIEYEKKTAEKTRKPHVIAQEARTLSTLTISPAEYAEFCRRTSMDAMVVHLSYTGQEGLGTRGRVMDWADLDEMISPPDMNTVREYLQGYIDAAGGTGVGVAAWVHSCFARTYELIGFENFALKLFDDRQFVEHVMDIFTDYSVAVAEMAAEMEISHFWVADDIADTRSLMISPRMLEELWLPRTQRILAPLQAKGIPIAYHCDGNLADVIPLALRLGVNAIQPFQANCNDIYEFKRQYGDRLCLMGNLDIAGPLVFGTAEEVVTDTRRHLEGLAPGGRYVLGSSHSITPAVKPENFTAMVETVIQYGSY